MNPAQSRADPFNPAISQTAVAVRLALRFPYLIVQSLERTPAKPGGWTVKLQHPNAKVKHEPI